MKFAVRVPQIGNALAGHKGIWKWGGELHRCEVRPVVYAYHAKLAGLEPDFLEDRMRASPLIRPYRGAC